MSDAPHNHPSFSALRRWGIGLNVCLAVTAMLAIVVMANYLGARHFQRLRWAPHTDIELSPQTRLVLAGLTNDVHVTIFYDSNDALFGSVSALINEYRLASPRVVVDTVDYVRNPAGAELIKTKYKLSPSTDKDLVIFEAENRSRYVYGRELSDYDLSRLVSGQSREVKRTAFKGEALFTSAILGVSSSVQPKAYFLQGHGEHNPADDRQENGYGKFVEVLRQSNVLPGLLTLVGTNEIPADCELLIIAGAKDRVSRLELDKLEKYLSQGGRLFCLFHFQTHTGLENVLSKWGIEVGDNVVFDPDNSHSGNDVMTSSYGSHPIVKPLVEPFRRLELALPRSVSKLEAGAQRADAPQVVELAFTGPKGVARGDIRNGVVYENPFRDRKGTLSLMVAVEKGGLPGVKVARGSTRIVVTGDSLFLDNEMIEAGVNRDFASLAANWLLDRTRLIQEIGPRPVREYKIVLTRDQMRSVRWILIGAMPGGVLLLGLLVWFRRQH